jgi:hypothetical protein
LREKEMGAYKFFLKPLNKARKRFGFRVVAINMTATLFDLSNPKLLAKRVCEEKARAISVKVLSEKAAK